MTSFETVPDIPGHARDVLHYMRSTKAENIPDHILDLARLYLLDCIGVLAAAGRLDAGRIARDHAVAHWAAGEGAPKARILFDGRSASIPGAAFAMATQLDNLDAHDGWQPSKGHAGAALIPALCAIAQMGGTIPGREALAHLVLGYEIANRAAIALHQTVADYHTSGTWNALGCVAIAARCLDLDADTTREALGIAEYHAPRSQMMREIANPSMLHDGSGFGAPVGLYAALIARDGFLGAPAATLEFADAAQAWQDLGQSWTLEAQYIKPFPICRWAHAAIDGALQLRAAHGLTPDAIRSVEIESFAYAADLTCDVPTSSHEAQYTLAWPVACALIRGRVGVAEILPEALQDPDLQAMTGRIVARATDEFESRYPEERQARVRIHLSDGQTVETGAVTASGGPTPQPSEAEVTAKFRDYAGTVLAPERVATIENAALGLTERDACFSEFLDLLYAP